MKVLSGATLNINGTLTDNVVLRGDRNDPAYDTIPKNWNSIKMDAGSTLNMNYARLFGGTKGLEMKQTNATINNSFIHTFQEYGIYAIGATITAKNLVMNNCGESAVGIFRGGTHNFTHCTIANYSDLLHSYNRNGIFAANEWTNDSGVKEYGALIFNLRNSIVYSDRNNSINFEQTPPNLFNFTIQNCLIKYSGTSEAGFDFSTNPSVIQSIKNQDPLFVNYFVAHMNLRVKQNSPAIGQGNTAVAATVPTDIANVSRTSNPTIGAYQYF